MIIDEAAARLETLTRLKSESTDPYPSTARRSHTVMEAIGRYPALQKSGDRIILAGRLRAIRGHGGMTFAHLEDGSGRMQIAWKKDVIGASNYDWMRKNLNVGDFIEVGGTLFTTKVGEKSLEVGETRILCKGLMPLPEKWHGLNDVEIRFRKRYLDLLSNSAVRGVFETRAKLLSSLRAFFDSRGYLEVETPVLQPIPGGAAARPFVTHHQALDSDLYLRIAPELYLKRLIVGGFERVYEISRCFRNEGIDHTHNPEFTQIEWYEAYAQYQSLMAQIEELLPALVRSAGLKLESVKFGNQQIDFTPPYERLTFREALKRHAKIDIENFPDRETLGIKAKSLGAAVTVADSRGKILDEIFKTFVRPKIVNPTFIIDHPLELSPLAKKKLDDPRYVERFQLLVAGMFELINGFSELNDPLDQEERFREQEKERSGGDEEAQRYDADFIEALKVGLPPTGGAGLGIDRLVMLLTDNHNIKEVILFPTLRPMKD